MSEKNIHEAVKLPPTSPPTKLELEKEAFVLMWGDLLKTHYGKYVAIHDGKVVAEGEESVKVAKAAYDLVGYVELYVGHVVRPTEQHTPGIRTVKRVR